MNSYKTEGVVIKRMNIGEAGKLITLFTKDHGKVTVMAKGVRKLSSKRAGSLELFNLLKCQIIKGKSQIDTLAEVQLLEAFSNWRKHLGRVTLAYQLCEVVDKLTPDHEPHPEIFNILTHALGQIGTFGSDWEFQIANLKLQILVELGYWPQDKILDRDINNLIEETSQRSFHSQKFLDKLK